MNVCRPTAFYSSISSSSPRPLSSNRKTTPKGWCRPLRSWERSMASARRFACRSCGPFYIRVSWPLRWLRKSRSVWPTRRRKSGLRLPLRRRETRASSTRASRHLRLGKSARRRRRCQRSPSWAARRLNHRRMLSWRMETRRDPRPLPRSAPAVPTRLMESRLIWLCRVPGSLR